MNPTYAWSAILVSFASNVLLFLALLSSRAHNRRQQEDFDRYMRKHTEAWDKLTREIQNMRTPRRGEPS